jgi:hypothetical protein
MTDDERDILNAEGKRALADALMAFMKIGDTEKLFDAFIGTMGSVLALMPRDMRRDVARRQAEKLILLADDEDYTPPHH